MFNPSVDSEEGEHSGRNFSHPEFLDTAKSSRPRIKTVKKMLSKGSGIGGRADWGYCNRGAVLSAALTIVRREDSLGDVFGILVQLPPKSDGKPRRKRRKVPQDMVLLR